MRIIFMGTPDFSVPTLMRLAGSGHEIAAVYTREPQKAGRGMELRKSPVHEAAERLGIPVHTPANFKNAEEREAFAAHGADCAVVVAYGLILPQVVLDATDKGCFNLHASLLPRWRGAAPINRAIMAGDEASGVMVMQMEKGLDTGPVAMAERVAIGDDMTAGQLHDILAERGADLMERAMAALSRDALNLTPQAEDGVTYAAKIDKVETPIDWSQAASDVHNHIRGLSPFPGAWTTVPVKGKSVRLKVLRSAIAEGQGAAGTVLDDTLTIACGEGAIRLLEVQPAGKQAMSAADYLRGVDLAVGTQLGA